MDGKHVVIVSPNNSGSMFYNYKGTYSIVLFAVVDAHYNYMYADVGCQGRVSDGGVFRSTSFFKKLVTNNLNLPDNEPLMGREMLVPPVLVADDAFPLTTSIMKPYPGSSEKGSPQRIFNYRLSRARRVVENVFGQMSAIFRVFRKPIDLQPDKVVLVVLTCIHLYNYLRRNYETRNTYYPPGTFDSECIVTGNIVPGTWRQEGPNDGLESLPRIGRNSSQEAKDIRDEYAFYFTSQLGRVPWQDRLA